MSKPLLGQIPLIRSASQLLCVSLLASGAALLFIGACGGSAFESAGGSGGSGGGSVSPQCGGPEDCNDGDVCTADFCTVDGVCAVAPKCSGLDKCCGGDCAQCCDDDDCDDGIACTTNTCFAGQCMYLPDDADCGPNEFCSVTESCRPKVPCDDTATNAAAACADASLCTSDSCVNGFCQNQFCDKGTVCCATGCAAECCDDSQCNKDDDPCTVGSCQDGVCHTVPLCQNGDKCCPSADGKSASCGACCSSAECDDKVGCTEDACTGARLTCSNNPNNAKCGAGEVCSAQNGCQKQIECDDAGDCGQEPCGRCEQGTCKYDCATGKQCCKDTSTCAVCCSDTACDDGIACTVDKCSTTGCTHEPVNANCGATGYICDPTLGGCVQCTSDRHCDDANTCTLDSCDLNTHACVHVSTCECQTGFDCAKVLQTDISQPIPVGKCHACVDGTCKTVLCNGNCCSSGCYTGLCPD